MRELKTKALVLKRTNYGEADRILQVLTPEGKLGVLAKSARKEKSRLAGGIELCSLSEMVLRGGKGDLMTLTGVRLIEFYGEIMRNWSAMDLLGKCLKEVSQRAEQVDVPEYFNLLQQVLENMNKILLRNANDASSIEAFLSAVRVWWVLNLMRASGEEMNLSRDVDGEILKEGCYYVWDTRESALRCAETGRLRVDSRHIKLMRWMLGRDLAQTLRVKQAEELIGDLLEIIKFL